MSYGGFNFDEKDTLRYATTSIITIIVVIVIAIFVIVHVDKTPNKSQEPLDKYVIRYFPGDHIVLEFKSNSRPYYSRSNGIIDFTDCSTGRQVVLSGKFIIEQETEKGK